MLWQIPTHQAEAVVKHQVNSQLQNLCRKWQLCDACSIAQRDAAKSAGAGF